MTTHADRDRSEPYWPPAATREPRVRFPLEDGDTGAAMLPVAPTEAQHDLRPGKYAEAMASGFGYRCAGSVPEDAIRAVMAVADAEQADIRHRWDVVRKELTRQEFDTDFQLQQRLAAEGALADERATVARVKAALDRVDPTKSATIMVDAVRAALGAP